MALPYFLVMSLLLIEMSVIALLLAPLPSSVRKWLVVSLSDAGKSQLTANIRYGMKIVFILVFILFIDSLTRSFKMKRIHNEEEDTGVVRDANYDTQLHAKMFYAQRNMYLTGFTLFLALVLDRLIFLMADLMRHEEKMNVIKTQAESQQKEYMRVTEEKEKYEETIQALQTELKGSAKKVLDAEVSIKQAKSQSAEYDRLLDKYNELERKVEKRVDESGKDK